MSKKVKNPSTQLKIDLNPEKTEIKYTDRFLIHTSRMGVVLDATQAVGKDRLRIVSRIGMSREQAKKFVQELSRTLALTESGDEIDKS